MCVIQAVGSINLTEIESERNLTHKWIPLKEAIDIFSEYEKYKDVFIC